MSFDMFVDENPVIAYDADEDGDVYQPPVATSTAEEDASKTNGAPLARVMSAEQRRTIDAASVVELGKVHTPAPGKHAPGVIFPAVAYVTTFAGLVLATSYSWILIHIVAVFMGFAVERIRESVVRQLKLDEKGDESVVGVALYTVPIVIAYKTYQICVAQPLKMIAAGMGKEIDVVDIDHVPMRRRKQTMAVLLWTMMLPMVPATYFITFTLTLTLPFILVPYLVWIHFVDKAPRTGSRQPRLRDISMGTHFVDYFPITLQRGSPPLDPSRKYVFCYHPHGIISLGAIGCFGLNSAGFPELFPGIDRRLLTLDSNFKVPFLREILLELGVCSVARQSCDAILNRGPGSAICIVVGGAAESLETQAGTYRLVLKRKGFVRVAVENGADLVPVFAFGETDAFSVLSSDSDSTLRKWQVWAQKKMVSLFVHLRAMDGNRSS